jgi:adenylate cyclase
MVTAISRDLDRYLSPEDRSRPLPADFEAADREVTIYLADVKGFTTFAEGRAPADVVRLLNDYFEIVIEEIFAAGGTLDKFIGDCVMAVFGAPMPKSNHATRAVHAAWRTRRRVAELNVRRRAEGKATVEVGYALNSGRVLSGYLGSDARRDFTVIGDAVNLASRIEDHVVTSEILVGQRTYSDVKNLARVKRLPPLMVKGKNEIVQMYRIEEWIENQEVSSHG